MSKIPTELKYSNSHEWVRKEDDGSMTVGITDHAQELLGDLVFIELPEVGRRTRAGEEIAVVESVKAASDIYAPVTGEISAINQAVADAPQLVNDDAYAAWLFKLTAADAAGYESLLSAAEYEKLISS